MSDLPIRPPNETAINPMARTNAQLEQLNETMSKMLEQLTRIQSWLVKIEMNTKAR